MMMYPPSALAKEEISLATSGAGVSTIVFFEFETLIFFATEDSIQIGRADR
jgi:hypothetical protein